MKNIKNLNSASSGIWGAFLLGLASAIAAEGHHWWVAGFLGPVALVLAICVVGMVVVTDDNWNLPGEPGYRKRP
jgi:hypothetical protein